MSRLPVRRTSLRLLGALALLGLGFACTSSATGPMGLRSASQRISDEAIGEDLAMLRNWQQRLDVIAARESKDPARRYLVSKAQAWLNFTREEYWANDRGPIIEESLGEAVKLMATLVDRDVHEVERSTKLPTGTRKVREDLWTEVDRFKAHPRFDLVAAEVAQLEIELVRAGHDAAPGAACSAEPHVMTAGKLEAYVDSVLKYAPPPVVVAEVPAPAPAPAVPLPPAPVVVPDRDGDGVPDALDCCPNTPAGKMVDARGCPEPTQQTQTVLEGVEFDIDRFALRSTSRAILDSVVTELLRRPAIPVEVSGHTDSIGTDSYNLTLSANRARSVRQYLVGKGVAGDRISAVGFGETRPRDSNSTRAGRQRNRRVELTWQLPVQLDLLPSCSVEPPPPPPPTVPDVTAVTPEEPAAEPRGPMGMTLDNVLFQTASIAVRQQYVSRLARVARQLRERERFVLEVAGHADDVGDPDSNFALSLARAYKVRAYLIDMGLPADRLVVRGYGADRPLVQGRTDAARARNRRVELAVRPGND